MVSLLIPLMIAGGFDGVEPLRDSATPRETLAAQPRQTACRKATLEKIEQVRVVYRVRVRHGDVLEYRTMRGEA